MHAGGIQVRRWMNEHVEQFRGPESGQIDVPALAEAAAAQFDCYDKEGLVLDRFYGYARDISDHDAACRSGIFSAAARELVNRLDSTFHLER